MDPWIHGSAAGAAAGAGASAATVCTYYVIIRGRKAPPPCLHDKVHTVAAEAAAPPAALAAAPAADPGSMDPYGDGPELLNKKVQFQTYHFESTPRALRQPTIACRLRSVRSLEANPSQNGALTIPLPLRSHYATTLPETPHGPEVCKFQQN